MSEGKVGRQVHEGREGIKGDVYLTRTLRVPRGDWPIPGTHENPHNELRSWHVGQDGGHVRTVASVLLQRPTLRT